MGDAQSAQREGIKDEAGEEESGKVDDAQAEQSPEDKPFKNNGQISEINEKAGSSIAKVNDHCEDEIATDAVLTPDEETENPLEVEEETPSKHIEKNEIESSNEADVAEDVPLDMTEMDAKTNDINDGFRRFFSNIGLRLSIKRGSTDLLRDLPDETNQDEPSGQENLEDSAEEIQIEDAEQNTEVNIAQVSTDNDSTTCPTMTDVTPEDVLENAEEKATEAKEDVESDNADSTTSPAVEDTQQDTTPEEEPNSLSPPEQADVVSPIKRFFTTGIFSGLRKKRKAVEDDVNEKEMVDMGKKEAVELAEETEYDQQEDKEQIDPGVEAAVADTEVKENELKQEILSVISAEKADEEKSPTTDHSTAIDTTTIFPESETQNSQEKDKVQASPLKRLLSGSSFKKLSKKPRSRRSSDAKLSDSGEHAADQLLSSTESTENQKEEKSTQPSPEATVQEDGAWVSFKKLLTPKKHTRTPSLSNKETEIPDSGEEPKPSDGEQISDHSTEEGKKRKDSSVSWEAVLCGSGKKRSRKTSDSEDESPQIDDNKQDIGSKNGAELPEESANEKKNDVSVSSPKQSPLIGDGGSTWKSFKRLVTPKRKAKDEDESKDIIQSDSEVSQDESSFSIKKLLPGRKKRKSAEKQDHISSDEADKDVPSDDEDSETPAVVPMSEFDTPESVIQIQTQVDIESHFPKEVPQDLVQQMPKPILSCDSLQNEAKELKENGDAVDNGTSTIPAKIEQLDNVSEIISKHQQLSDITEEGMITETMATPISINEEVGRDDTLAEDLLEITSEAITAPEPASVTTLADETEMISAVSQLSSESSKTSGNTTPVPAEYEVKETEELLHQVVENISTSPMAVPISSTTPKSESIVGSVLHHIFRTFVKDKETTILEIHRKSDATAINTGQTAEELDAVNEVRATAQTESISEVNDSDPKEFLPDIREKLDTAEITKDEVHEDHPIDPEQSLKELERINEIENDSHHQDEIQLDANAAGSVVESLQAEMETPKMGTEDPPLKEFKEETELPREVKVEPEKVDESYTDACKTEYVQLPDAIKGEVTVELKEETLPLTSVNLETVDTSKTDLVSEPHVLHALQASSLDSMADDGLSLEKLPDVEMDTVEPKHDTEVTAEPEGKLLIKAAETDVEDTVKDTKPEVACIDTHVVTESTDEGSTTTPHTEGSLESADSSKTVHVQEPEVQGTLFGLLMRSLLPHKKVSSDDVAQKLTITDEPQPKTEVGDEPEQKLPDEVVTAEHVQEPEGLPSEEENSLKDTKTEEGLLMDKHEVTESIAEDSATLPIRDDKIEPVDASETQKEPQELQMLQPAILDPKTGGLLSLEQKISEDFSAVETVTEKPRQETEVRVGSEEKLLVKAAKTDDVQESQVLPSDVEDTIRDTSTDGGESMDVSVVTEIIEECATIPLNEESIEPANPSTTVLPFDGENTVKETSIEGGTSIHVPEVTESTEGGDEKILLTKKSDKPVDLSTTEQVKAQVEAQTSPLDSEVGNLLPFEKVISEDIPAVETVTEEPKKETGMWVEAVTTEYVQLPEPLISDVKEPVAETSIEEGASIHVPVVTERTEVGHTTVTLTKGSPESVDASKTEHVEEPEDLSLHLKVDSLLLPEKVISELIPAIETITEQPQEAAEVSDETADKQTVGITKTEPVIEIEVLSSNAEDSVKDTKTEEGASTNMQVVTESTEEGSATTTQTEGSLEHVDPSKTDHVEEAEESQTVQESLLSQLMNRLLPQKKLLSDDLSQIETVTDETQPETEVKDQPEENLPVEAEHIPELEDLSTVQEAQFDSRASSLFLEKIKLEDITAVETVRDKPQDEAELRVEPEEKLQAKGAKTDDIQELEVLPSDVEDSVKDIKTEEDASTGMQVVTECTEEGTETIPHTEGSLEPEEPPKTDHVEELEESQTVQESLLGKLMRSLLPDNKELSDDLLQKETVTDETQPETEVMDESEENVPVEAEHIPEPEVITTVQEAQFDSRASGQSHEKVVLEDITAVETVRDEPQNETELRVEPEEKLQVKGAKTNDIQEPEVLPSDVEDCLKDIKTEEDASTGMQVVTECTEEGTETIPHTEGSLEPEEPPKTDHVEELEESQTVQESLLGKLMRSLLPDNKELSDDLLQKETVTDEPQPATEVRQEPEENVPVEAEHIPEPEVITTVQEAQFDSRASGQSHEKVILDDITAVETVRDEPQNETELRVEPEEKLQVKGAKTNDIQEPEVLPSDVEDCVKDIKTEEDASTGMQVVTECTEEGTETIPHTEGSLEPKDPPKTDHVEELEESQTVQESLLGKLMRSLLPDNKELSDDLLQKETVTDEPQPATEVRQEPEENVPVEAEHIPEPEVITTVQEAQFDSRASGQSHEKVILEDITAVETVRDEPQNETELRVEPEEKLKVKDAKTNDIQEPEVLPSDVEDCVKDIETEEDASTGMQVVTECTEEGTETIPHTEGSLEPEDPPKTDHVEELEESQTVQESLLGKLMRSLLPDNKELSDDLLQKETVTDEPQPATEVRQEPEENVPVEAEHIPEPEVITTVQEAQFDSRARGQSHEKVILEDITAVETVRDEPQNETELRVEPEEKLQVKGAKTNDIQEPEVLPSDVEDCVKDIKTEEDASTGMQVVTECTEEGTETIPHTEGSLEPEEPPKTDHVEELEESQTVQESLLGKLMRSLLPDNKELSDDLLQKETVTDETQPETEVMDESEENVPVDAEHIPVPEVLTTVQEAQFDSRASSQSHEKVIFEDITAVKTLRDNPQTETELKVEPEEKLQVKVANTDDVQEPEVLPSDVEDSVDDIQTEESASTGMQVVTECTEEGTETIPLTEGSLEPEDPPKTDHLKEPEESKTVQESLLGQLMHIFLPQKKVFSEDLLQKETVTDETQPDSEENVPVEAEHIPEPEVITTVQEAQFDSRASSQSHEKVILKDITAVETVRDEPQKETGFRFEPEEKLKVKDAKTENVQESEVLPSSVEDTVKKTEIEENASLHVPETTESIEGGDAAISVTEGSPESMDLSTAEQVKAQEESQTVQASPLDSDMGSLLPSETVISEDIPAVQVPDLLTSDVEDTVMETLTEQGPSIPMPVVTESAEVESATVLLSEGSFESVDASSTEHVQGPEILQTDQKSPFESKAGSLFPPKKVTTKDILAIEIVTEDPQNDETERVQEPQVLQTAQGPAIDSNVADILHLKKVVSGDIHTNDQETEARVAIHGEIIVEDTDTECVMEPVVLPSDVEDTVKVAFIDTNVVTGNTEEGTATIPHTEGSLEPVDPLKTDFVEEREESLLGRLMHSLLPHKKASSDDLSLKETLTNEPQPRTEVRDEPEKNVPVEAVTTEYVQEPEVLPSDIEETEKETQTKEDALTDLHVIRESTEGGKATLLIIEGALEPVHHSKTEWVQEPEQLQTVQPSRLDSKAGIPLIEQILSEDITAVATYTDEHTLEAVVRVELEEEQPIEASKTEYVQEQEVLPSDAKDNVKETKTEEHTSMYVHAVTETTVPKPDADNTIASITDTIEREVVAQSDQAAEKSDGHKTEHIINNASVLEQEDSIPEVAVEVLAISQVHVSSVNEESTYVQILENPLFPEEIQAPAVDNATNKDEFKHDVHLSAVQVSVEREKESELSSTEINTAALGHAIVTQVVTCDLEEVSATILDLLPEKTLGITEPLINRVTSQEVSGEANTTKPLVKDDSVTAEQYTVIQRMHVSSTEFEGNHKIQVQVVDVNLKSAGTIVDNLLEVGVTETKEVIDYCQETMKTVENLSATPDIETKITVQEVTQHVPEKVSESAVTILEQAVIKQPDALTAVSELAESESNQMGNQKVIKDGTGTLTEKDEKSVVISDDSATAQQVSEDLTHAPDLPFGLNVSIGSHREKLEQTKAKQAKSEAGVTVREIKALSEEADVKEVNEPAQITQTSQGPILTPSNTGLVVPQNTGIISSIGNVESPSSLSLEFKLNIQFGQAKAQTPSPPTEQIEPMKKTHVSDVGVQAVEAVEPVKPIIPTQRAESHNQIDLTEVKDITVTATNFVYTERALTTTQPDLLGVGINTIETVESITKGPASPPMPTDRIETVKQTDVFVVGVQAVESVETVKPFILTQSAGSEKQIESTVVNVALKEIPGPDSLLVLTERAVLTTQPVLLDVAIHAIETEELVSKAKTSQSLPEIIDCSEPVKQMDVLEAGSQAIHALEPLSLRRIEATEVNDQPTEITKPAANLVLIERALIMTHPQLLEVGINSIKTVEPVATTPDSLPSTTDRTETEKETDVAEVGFQALKATEPAKTVTPPEREIQKQIEPIEVNNQSTEITEPATILESTKRAVITTYPELLGEVLPSDAEDTLKDTKNEEAASIDTHVVKESTKESATVPHTDDSLEPGDPSKTEHVQEPEVKESLLGLLMRSLLPHKKVLSEDFSQKETVANEHHLTEVRDEPEELLGVGIHPTEAVELVEETIGSAPPTTDQEQIEPTKVNNQPIEITQPVANLVETALITTQPKLLDVGVHLIETVELIAKASVSPPPVMEIINPVKKMDVLEVEVQAIEAVIATEINEIQKQIDLTEVSNQQIAIKEPGTLLGSTERAVMTQPELLDVGINTIRTVQPEATSPPSSQAITERIELGKQMHISEHGFQAEEAEEPVNTVLPAQRAESPKQVELAEVNVQQTETTEPEAQLVSNEKAVIMTHPVLLDLGIHAIETIEPDPNASATPQVTTDITEDLKETNLSKVVIQVEEAVEYEMPINSTQRAESQEEPQLTETDAQATEVTETAVNVVIPAVITTQPVLLDNGIHPITTVELVSNAQAKETMQPASQPDDREVFRSEPVQSEDCDQETKAKVNNTEEENDQDVWMDAEEVIYNQEVAEKSSLEIEEPEEEVEAECVHEEEAKLEEVEFTSYSRTEEEESQQEVYNRGETCEIESEGEDFAIALEHQEYATASITTLEWD